MPTPAPHRLDRYREPGMLFGGGLLAGLLLFGLWYAFQPSAKTAPGVTPVGAPADTSKPGRKSESVLGDISPGPARAEADPGPAQDEPGLDAESSPENGIDPDGVAQDEAAPPLSDEEAIAGGLLSDGVDAAPLRTWYIEVLRGPNVSEILEVEATSPEHALAILRDFRGDPRVVRGPSDEPFP